MQLILWLFSSVCLILNVDCITYNTSRPVSIYQTVDNDQILYCNKLLNGSATIGCDGPLFPEFGILLFNVTEDKIDYIGNNSFYYSFIPILNASEPNLTQILIKLNQVNQSIVGVLIVNKNASAIPKDNFVRSDDVACPNQNSLNQTDCYKWIDSSDSAIGSFFRHWAFPIFYLEDSNTIDIIENCTFKWNLNLFESNGSSISFHGDDYLNFGAFCAAELYQPNYASTDINADRCLAQTDRIITLEKVSYCDKIHGNNILAPLMPMYHNNIYENRSILVLAVRLDSLTLFSGKSPAADSVYSALITSISVAQTLFKNRHLFENTTRQVIFAFYKGESLGYIGSSFHAFDLNNNRGKNKTQESLSGSSDYSGIRNINLDQIGFVLELNQLANHGNDSTFWLYSNQKSNESDSLLRGLLLKWSYSLPSVSMKQTNSELPYPPSSIYSFKAYNNCQIETVMITNHQGSFTNRYYHSLFDQAFNVFPRQAHITNSSTVSSLVAHLSGIATVVSRTLAEFLVNSHNTSLQVNDILANVDLINQTVECIFVNPNCSFFHQIQRPGYYNESNFQDTDILSSNNVLTNLVFDLMSHLTGDTVVCPNETESDQEKAYLYRTESTINNTKMCLRFQVFQMKTTSPYFISNSSHYLSQWVIGHHRPLWAFSKLRIFLLPTRSYDFMVASLGIIVIFISIIVMKLCFESEW